MLTEKEIHRYKSEGYTVEYTDTKDGETYVTVLERLADGSELIIRQEWVKTKA